MHGKSTACRADGFSLYALTSCDPSTALMSPGFLNKARSKPFGLRDPDCNRIVRSRSSLVAESNLRFGNNNKSTCKLILVSIKKFLNRVDL